MERLLILGAGRGQCELYKAARELGIWTIAGTLLDKNPPGIKLADEVCCMDISNPEEVLEKAKKLDINGVATCCLDTGVHALGKVCDSLNLIGLSEVSAIMCTDKLKMKRALVEHNVSTAKFYEISSKSDLMDALENLNLPVVIKATDLQGSNGVYISDSEEAAIYAFEKAMSKTRNKYCIVEEYIDGWEFGAQAYIYKNEILFVMPHGDETYLTETAVPIGHYIPLDCSENVLRQTEIAVKSAIHAIGLNNCAVNVDLILRDGIVYVIELTGRAGANCLPELVQINYGIEYYKMIAAMAIGEDPKAIWDNRVNVSKAGVAKMIIETQKGGRLEEISIPDKRDNSLVDITFFKHVGDSVQKFKNSNDCIGQIIAEGNNIKECESIIVKELSNIKIEIV